MGDCNCKHGTNGAVAVCPECDILQMARNNYFTGKLLVERDFTDEQRYTMGKLRRHNQRLHGWGVVCGLKVKQHPNPACQSQYVIVEPGTAIDCCGREILLTCEEYFDFENAFLANWQKQHGPGSQPDNNPHTLQICISYKECPAENVPAIFDDCSTGGGSCQPNRILEGHSLDVITDPVPSTPDPQGVTLKWDFTKNIANAVKVAEDDASNRVYVLTSVTKGSTSTAALYVIDTTNYTFLTPVTYAKTKGLDVAVSPSGDFVYVAVQPATGAPQINVYKASDFTTTVNQLSVGTVTDPTVRLATYPATEGSLFAFGNKAGVVAWSGVDASGATSTTIASITAPVAMAVSEKNQYAYVATSGSSTVAVITLGTLTVTAANNITLPTAPASLSITGTTGDEKLAALDTAGAGTLYFVTIPAAGPASTKVISQSVTGFTYSPMQVLLSPGGKWAYVLEQDTATSNAYVQVVDEHAVELGKAKVLGDAVAVGIGPQSETLSDDGTHLYVPFINASQPNLGGVAIVEVIQADCGDIFQTIINCCPDCDQGNCLVLATITGYVYQNPVTDSEIDNLTDRHLLVSTDILTKAVQCLINQGTGTGPVGPQGPVGPAGTNGATWYEGNGAPGALAGNNNDLYLDISSGDIYQMQAGAWKKIGNIKGPSGTPGTNGATWHEGNGAPGALAGNNNDLYLDIATDDVYQMQAGSWVKIGNIKGAPGTNGTPGQDGAGITAVSAKFVTCDQPGSASLSGPKTSQTLNLTIPGCCNTSLVKIAGISWTRNGGKVPVNDLQQVGLKIAFSEVVQSADLTPNSIVLLSTSSGGQLGEVAINITPGNFATLGKVTSAFTPASGNVNGLSFVLANASAFQGLGNLRIFVKGDFIRDKSGHGVDGDHLPPWLPARPTGDGIEGGTFESWFTVSG
ncbi:MAG TPA: hypothetical protein VI636_25255 [Candidatus Angelobacter sp.]